MAIFTEEQFRNIAYQNSGPRGLTGIVNESRSFSKESSSSSIFLSHSHLDKAKVEQAKIFFENLNISIYVDWMDETMPLKTSGYTANSIKSKIRENKKFILLATNTAVNSKWCNWEVGIGDIYKYDQDDIAILGIADNKKHWTGNEYLQIYPSIELLNGENKNMNGALIESGYYVLWPEESNGERDYMPLKNWLLS